jgi:hypothetical protein
VNEGPRLFFRCSSGIPLPHLLEAGFDIRVSWAVYAVAIGTLVVLAVVSLFTGFKVALLPFRLCPFIFGVSAVLIVWGAWL